MPVILCLLILADVAKTEDGKIEYCKFDSKVMLRTSVR